MHYHTSDPQTKNDVDRDGDGDGDGDLSTTFPTLTTHSGTVPAIRIIPKDRPIAILPFPTIY